MNKLLISALTLFCPAFASAQNQPAAQYGIYSHKAAQEIGSFTYTTPEGDTILVTSVGSNPSFPNYAWDDARVVGRVEAFVAKHPPYEHRYFKRRF
jgi:hypothetical protein